MYKAFGEAPFVQSQQVPVEFEWYDAFTDIEFNPRRSINCQTIAAAMYVDLARAEQLQDAFRDRKSFVKIAYGVSY